MTSLIDRWMGQATFAPDDGGGVAGAAPSDGGASAGGSSVAPGGEAADGGGSVAGGDAAPADSGASLPDWANLGSVDDLDHIEIPQEAQPPVTPPTSVPQPVEPPKPAPLAQPVPPQAAAPEGQPPPEAAKPLSASDPWRIAEGLEANRAAVIAHLAQSKFALSEEDIRDLDTDVTVAVPKLLSRVFLESQMAMQKFLAQAVPGMIKQYQTVTSANDSAEKTFFERHKALNSNDPQHRAAAVRIASVYRQANPNIPLSQLIDEVGPMVMAALRINGPGPATAVPAPPVPPRGGTPFRPAVNGGGGSSPLAEPPNEWAGLGTNYD